jgi:hypothetical protein
MELALRPADGAAGPEAGKYKVKTEMVAIEDVDAD